MARTKTKSGSKVKVTCQLCGKVMTKAGLIGHMQWKHGKDHKAPMLDKPKPMQYQEARRKAQLFDLMGDNRWAYLFDNLVKQGSPCCHRGLKAVAPETPETKGWMSCQGCGEVYEVRIVHAPGGKTALLKHMQPGAF